MKKGKIIRNERWGRMFNYQNFWSKWTPRHSTLTDAKTDAAVVALGALHMNDHSSRKVKIQFQKFNSGRKL